MLREGDLLVGKYRVERLLGEGGMGYVMAAMHEQLHQRVAVKFLAETHAKNPESAARFLREARAAVRIQSEHVARVIDVCELDDGSPFMVMEFLHGNDLADELERAVVFSPDIAIDYLLQACEALAEAHAIGLVHRDLKPANLFLTRRADGSSLVKVLDFGISKAISATASRESAALTTAQAILGSPAYMSPEQARKPKSVDARTDIWSLGIILYEFLTGEVPFTGDTLLSVIAAAFSENPPNVRTLRPELPEGIDEVVERCLAKSPDDRYQTVAEFADALSPLAEPHSLPSVARIRGTLRLSSIPPPMQSTKKRPPQADATDDTLPNSAVALSSQPEVGTLALPDLGARAATAAAGKGPTLSDWGSTQPGRSRRRALIAGGSVALVVVLGLIALASSNFAARTDGAPSPAARASAEARPASVPAEAEAVKSAPPVAAAPAPVIAAEVNTLPVSSASAGPDAAASAKAPVPPAPKRVRPPAAAAVAPHPANPLDGRL